MKKLELTQMENLQGGRPCIGTGVVRHTYANGCYINCLQDYFLWISVGQEHDCDAEQTCPFGETGL